MDRSTRSTRLAYPRSSRRRSRLAVIERSVVFLLLVSALGSALTWHLARMVAGDDGAAWFGWAAVTLSATWIFHSFTVYPDGPGAVLTLTGVWAILRAEREAGTAERVDRSLALAWRRTGGVAVDAHALCRDRGARRRAGAAAPSDVCRMPPARRSRFCCVPAISGLAWLSYFIKIYGTPNPSVPYGNEVNSLAFHPGRPRRAALRSAVRSAPIRAGSALPHLAGVGVMLTRPALRRYALELLFVVAPYLLVVTYVAMWWGGASAPARFFAPVLLWMAVPAAIAWRELRGRTPRTFLAAALAFTASRPPRSSSSATGGWRSMRARSRASTPPGSNGSTEASTWGADCRCGGERMRRHCGAG